MTNRVYIVRSKNGIAFRHSARLRLSRDRERIGPLSGQMLVGIKEERDVKSNVVMLLCEDFHGIKDGYVNLEKHRSNLLTEVKRRRYRVVASRGVAWRQRCEYESRVTCTPGPCFVILYCWHFASEPIEGVAFVWCTLVTQDIKDGFLDETSYEAKDSC